MLDLARGYFRKSVFKTYRFLKHPRRLKGNALLRWFSRHFLNKRVWKPTQHTFAGGMAVGFFVTLQLFPTTLGPVARAYFRLNSKLPAEEKKKRSGLYGSLSDAFSTMRPFEIEPGLMEVPVTTMPLVRFPVHLSYLLFLAQYSEALARLYWRTAVTLCRIRNIGPSLLLHPTDFLDGTDVPRMSFFPAMKIPAQRKIALVRFALGLLKEHWNTGTVAAHARAGAAQIESPLILQPSSQTTA